MKVFLRLLSLEAVVLLVWVGCAMYVHFRGRIRHRFWRQFANYATFLAPYNTLMYCFSAVPRKPFLELSRFPQLQPLQQDWRSVREEAVRLWQAGVIAAPEKKNDIAFNSFLRKGWTRFYLKWYDEFLPSAREQCPKTVALVQSIPSIKAAMFAILPPGAKLSKHRDPFAGSLRYHLGLVTPNSDACGIRVDGEPYSWRDGEAVVFDETYIHSAHNDTDQHRIILFCDVTRPLHTPVVRTLNRLVSRYIVKISASNNMRTEKLGMMNRVSDRLYRFRTWSRKFKKAHHSWYFFLDCLWKAALIVLLLYAAFRDSIPPAWFGA